MATQYEIERAERIKENQALLSSLGISDAKKAVLPVIKLENKPRVPSEARKRKRVTATVIEPARKSARLSGVEAKSMSERDLEAAERSLAGTSSTISGPSRIQLKQLQPVAIPEVDEDVDYDPDYRAPPPTRDGDEEGAMIHFEAEKSHFTPNLTPSEMMRAGSFGGSYFRRMWSRVAKRQLEEDYDEFPEEWYEGIDVEDKLTRPEYENSINRYGVKAGQSIEDWENAGWIRPVDPRGWFQWYCRFYVGRRTSDDERQIKRWLGVCGPTGRFKTSLVKKIAASGKAFDDPSVSPILRQTLLHWACHLTEETYQAYL